jgi:hypothetical protein
MTRGGLPFGRSAREGPDDRAVWLRESTARSQPAVWLQPVNMRILVSELTHLTRPIAITLLAG